MTGQGWLGGVLAVVALTGCSVQVHSKPNDLPSKVDQARDDYLDNLMEVHVPLKDGRTVTCLSQMTPNGNGGLSCEWAGAR